jgi:hypothetical protein
MRYTDRMARQESSREDLLREATALVERIELAPRTVGAAAAEDNAGDRLVAGFRSDGALSIFFGEDPVYQFNAAGELRRAYSDGTLVKAVRGRLTSLERVRKPHEVQLVRHELTAAEEVALIQRMTDLLRELASSLDAGRFEVIGQVPRDANVLGRLRAWLAAHKQFPIAARPNVHR